MKIRTGRVRKEPPPAIVFMNPQTVPTPKRAARGNRVSIDIFYGLNKNQKIIPNVKKESPLQQGTPLKTYSL